MKALSGILLVLWAWPLRAQSLPDIGSLPQPRIQALHRQWQDEGWQKLAAHEGLRAYEKIQETGTFKAMGGEGIIPASIDRVLHLIFDVNHAPDWVYRVKRADILEESSDGRQIVQYTALGLPFPFSDRDFIVKYQVQPQPKDGSVRILVESAEHPAAPPTVGVRARIRGHYDFVPIGKDQVYGRVEIFADPGGTLPHWVVRMLQERWPLVTLFLMREAVKNKVIPPLARYDQWMKDQG